MPALLFVCSGNTCRSPIAEALFKARLAQSGQDLAAWRIESAGTAAAGNQSATPLAVQVMAARGLDLQQHRSRRTSAEHLAGFDLVLCMDSGHQAALKADFPTHSGRIHLLSQMAGQTANVEDPFGGALADYQQTAQEIDDWLALGMNTILSTIKSS